MLGPGQRVGKARVAGDVVAEKAEKRVYLALEATDAGVAVGTRVHTPDGPDRVSRPSSPARRGRTRSGPRTAPASTLPASWSDRSIHAPVLSLDAPTSATTVAAKPWSPPRKSACSPPVTSGGRSGSPVRVINPPAANCTAFVACHPDRGPVWPIGDSETTIGAAGRAATAVGSSPSAAQRAWTAVLDDHICGLEQGDDAGANLRSCRVESGGHRRGGTSAGRRSGRRVRVRPRAVSSRLRSRATGERRTLPVPHRRAPRRAGQ